MCYRSFLRLRSLAFVLIAWWYEVASFQPSRGRRWGTRAVSQSSFILQLTDTGPSNDEEEVNDPQQPEPVLGSGDLLRDSIRRLAELSLEDYKWRSSAFKTNQADRMMEESLARMQGKEAVYVRPMDAGEEKIGPLGRLEKAVVDWLSNVIEEEARRAERIVKSDGYLVRPIDAQPNELGPLGFLEKRWVDFWQSIRSSEEERIRTGTLRPKDLEETVRGPLGNLELKVVTWLRELEASERLRMQQSRTRGGEIVRPIDIPGPLGEIELAVSELINEEQELAKAIEDGKFIRPKDAQSPGPLGLAEQWADEVLEALKVEENERLRSIEKFIKERRPMNAEQLSIWGFLEALAVGIVRAPFMLLSVFQRVQELMSSENLDDVDMDVIRRSGNADKSSVRSVDESK